MSRANYNFMPVSWRKLVKAAGVIVLALPAILRAQDGVAEKQESRIEIKRRGSQPPTEAPAEHFTGRVRIEPLFQENDPSHTSAAYVTFERCAFGMAYSSARSDSNRDGWHVLG